MQQRVQQLQVPQQLLLCHEGHAPAAAGAAVQLLLGGTGRPSGGHRGDEGGVHDLQQHAQAITDDLHTGWRAALVTSSSTRRQSLKACS
eukprot:scaffold58203_cov18-Tisochrysis_lutea.AAC.1